MDLEDFYDLVEDTVERLLPRVPQKYVRGFKSALHGGEYGIVVENLVYTVADDAIPVSPEERDILHRLVEDMPGNEKLLAKLDRFIIVEDGAG